MILVFDLDDTLYDELEYVKSGHLNVSTFLSKKISTEKYEIYSKLCEIFNKRGRKKVFSHLLKDQKLIKECILKYRNHIPNIKLYNEAKKKLSYLSKRYHLYMVTNGYKETQKRKIKSLKIKKFFKKIYIANEYGKKNMKPSLFCFKKIKQLERCEWKNICYIGDDPRVDFINLNKVGAKTIRIRKGQNFRIKLKGLYEAKKTINSITKLNDKLIESL